MTSTYSIIILPIQIPTAAVTAIATTKMTIITIMMMMQMQQ